MRRSILQNILTAISLLILGIGDHGSAIAQPNESIELATFAGGCFWCVVKPFHQFKGVKSVISGYTGGALENPSYEQVSTGKSGHYEAVQIEYNPKMISYRELLAAFWKAIDPTDGGGQFSDRGSQYKPAIFFHSKNQKIEAEKSKQEMSKMSIFRNKKIEVEILPAKIFWKAEDYHQDYYKKNPVRYQRYFEGSGRKIYLEETWSPKNQGELKKD